MKKVNSINALRGKIIDREKSLNNQNKALSDERYGLMLGEGAYKQEKAIEERDADVKSRELQKEFIDNLPLPQSIGIRMIGGAVKGAENIAQSFMMYAATGGERVTQEELDNATGAYKELLLEQKSQSEKDKLALFKASNKMGESAKETAKKYGLVNELGEVDFQSPIDYVNFAVTAATEQLPQIPLAATTLGASTYAQTSGAIMGEIVNEKYNQNIAKGMSEEDAFKSAAESEDIDRAAVAVASIGVASLDLLGAGTLLKGMGKSTMTKMLANSIKGSGLKNFATGTLTEMGTEVAQEFIEAGGKKSGVGESFIEGVKSVSGEDVLNVAAKTFFGAGGFSAVSAYTSNGTITDDNVKMLVKASKDDKVLKNIEEQIALQKINGELTQSEYEERVTQLANDVEYARKIDEDLSESDQVKAMDLVKSKYELEAEISGKDVVDPKRKNN